MHYWCHNTAISYNENNTLNHGVHDQYEKIYIVSKWCDIRLIWYHITTSSMNKYYTMRKLRCADTRAWYYNYLRCKQPYMANMKIHREHVMWHQDNRKGSDRSTRSRQVLPWAPRELPRDAKTPMSRHKWCSCASQMTNSWKPIICEFLR